MPGSKTRVYITIDTETSVGGAWNRPDYEPLSLEQTVFGRIGSRFYGIPLIMDILEEFQLRATFFTEVFCSWFVGPEEVARACRMITQRGHDCQLHLHPVFYFYREYKNGGPAREQDLMFRLSPQEQHDLIGEGVRLFRDITGVAPRAYRAGCYAASETTLAALHENGIAIDSSYNLAYMDQTCGFQTPGLNAPCVLNSVYEFPVTVFRVAGVAGFKPLEISAVSVSEILAAIEAQRRAGCEDIVLVFHSASFLKNTGLRFEHCSPDQIVIRRFRELCAAFARMRDQIEVRAMGDLELSAVPAPQPQVIPALGWFRPAVRKMVQAANRIPWL